MWVGSGRRRRSHGCRDSWLRCPRGVGCRVALSFPSSSWRLMLVCGERWFGHFSACCLCRWLPMLGQLEILLCYNQLRNKRAISPENKRGISRETSWKQHKEEARLSGSGQKARGTIERDRTNTTCSALTSMQRLHKRAAPP